MFRDDLGPFCCVPQRFRVVFAVFRNDLGPLFAAFRNDLGQFLLCSATIWDSFLLRLATIWGRFAPFCNDLESFWCVLQ